MGWVFSCEFIDITMNRYSQKRRKEEGCSQAPDVIPSGYTRCSTWQSRGMLCLSSASFLSLWSSPSIMIPDQEVLRASLLHLNSVFTVFQTIVCYDTQTKQLWFLYKPGYCTTVCSWFDTLISRDCANHSVLVQIPWETGLANQKVSG